MKIIKLFDIKEPAQEFMESPKLKIIGVNYVLMYDFEDEDGEYHWTGTTFLDTIAFKQTSDEKINEFQIKAYNAVVEVTDSEWINELSSNDQQDSKIIYKHFMVYFDGYGAFEFLSTSVVQGIIE